MSQLNAGNLGEYTIEGQVASPSNPNATVTGEWGKVNPRLPITFVLLPSRLTRTQAKSVLGGQPNTPFGLDTRLSEAAYAGLEFGGNGQLGILLSNVPFYTESGMHDLSNPYNIVGIHELMAYVLVEPFALGNTIGGYGSTMRSAQGVSFWFTGKVYHDLVYMLRRP